MIMITKIFGWVLLFVALAFFIFAVVLIAAVFGKDVALIVTLFGLGMACMGMGNKMIV